MSATLATGSALGAIAGALFLVVGALLVGRARGARSWGLAAFALFWLGVGAYGLADAAGAWAALAAWRPFPVALAMLHVKVAAVTVGFGSLVAYLVYIRSGRRGLALLALAYYALVWIALEAFYAYRDPMGVNVGTWSVSIAYAHEALQPAWNVLLVALLAPALAASVLYAGLRRHTEDPEVRQRIVLTSTALALFFGPTLLAWLVGSWAWWALAEKMLGLVTAGVMMVPAFSAWQEGRAPGSQTLAGTLLRRARRQQDIERRLRDLV